MKRLEKLLQKLIIISILVTFIQKFTKFVVRFKWLLFLHYDSIVADDSPFHFNVCQEINSY